MKTGIKILVIAVAISGIAFISRACGLWGDTYVERKVFEESYQRHESIKARIAADRAVLSEIEVQLSNPDLEAGTRFNLEAQARAARVRIETAKQQQR